MFVRNGTKWSQQAYLEASNTEGTSPPVKVFGDEFGSSVAVSGDTVVVAANLEDSNATGVNGNQTNNSAVDSGAVYVYWFSQPNEENATYVSAWTGTNESSRKQGRTIRLYKSTSENPIPGAEVKSIDFVSNHEVAAPFLIAIKIE